MISLYSGTPGSGKSLHIAQRIYHGLKVGRKTICNFDVNLEKISKRGYKHLPFIYIDNIDLSPDRLIQESWKHFTDENGNRKRIKEDDILVVIDECQILFNSRNWQNHGRDKWLSFFSQHRKYGFEIVLVAQFDGMIDKQIRTLIEYEIIHRKVSNFGIVGKIMSSVALGKMFCAVKMWYPLKERLSSEFFTARKRYYSIYDTYGSFATLEKVKKEEALKTPS